MAKVVFIDPVNYVSGKISKSSNTVYCYNAKTDHRFVRAYTPQQDNPTENQVALRQKFAKAVTATYTRLNDSAQRPIDEVAFAKQTKYKTIFGFVFSQVYAAED